MIATAANIVDLLEKDNFLQVGYVYSYRSSKYWRICKTMVIALSNNELITIPEGFYTDLSSVPKWLWSITRPYGDFLMAAVIHDYLYVKKRYPQKFCDKEMLHWSKLLNNASRIRRVDNYIRYYAVRLFGWTYWNRKSTTQRELKPDQI